MGKWKYVHGSTSCQNDDCRKDMLYDLEVDLSEKNDVSNQYPDVLKAIKANFTTWYDSISNSRSTESLCGGNRPTPAPMPTPPPLPSDNCDWHNNTGLDGGDLKSVVVTSKEECCGQCKATV